MLRLDYISKYFYLYIIAVILFVQFLILIFYFSFLITENNF